MASWTETPIHLIDFEGHPSFGVVEWGVASVVEGTVAAFATGLSRPRRELSDQDRNILDLSESEFLHEEPFASEFERFTGLRRSGCLGAHHAVFENRLIRSEWLFPPASPDWSLPPGEDRRCASWGPWVDTLLLARRALPGLESYRLADLIDVLGCRDSLEAIAAVHLPKRLRRWHRAGYDALASALILTRFAADDRWSELTLRKLLGEQQALPADAKQTTLFGN